jgi:pullulanase/glycogen debranching enzyme
MSNDFRPDEPWNWVDWDRLQDALAGLIKKAEEDRQLRKEYSMQLDIVHKQLKAALKENEELKNKIVMMERIDKFERQDY